jgi:CspA family cold shock protein
MEQGVVKWFNNAKGFGFIKPDDGGDVFVHYKSIEGEGYKKLKGGEIVEYEAQMGPKGMQATVVRKLEEEEPIFDESML